MTYRAEIAKLSKLPAETSFILEWNTISTNRPMQHQASTDFNTHTSNIRYNYNKYVFSLIPFITYRDMGYHAEELQPKNNSIY